MRVHDEHENWVTNGASVTFTTGPEGSFASPSVVKYTQNGQASALFTAMISGTATITVVVTDAGEDNLLGTADDGSIMQTFDIIVDAVNDPPTLQSPVNQLSTEGEQVSLGVVADDPDGDTLSFSATGLPAGLGIDPATGTFVPPEDRRIGALFQDVLLFPHLDVTANVAFALRAGAASQREADREALSWLDRFELGDLASPVCFELARVARLEGNVILQAIIHSDGSVGDVEVLRTNRPNMGFEEAAIQAVTQWRYQPALQNGRPVEVYFTVFVEFKLH